MADYTFQVLAEPLKNNNTIQTILDVDALAAPAKAALAGYVASLGLPAEKTQHLLWENIGVAVILESLAITYYLPSLGVQTPAPALKRTASLSDKVTEMQALESRFPKCQILIFARTSAASTWVWLNTEVIQNSGNRVNTLKLNPYLNQSNVFIPGRGTQIGLQFIADPVSNSTLPQAGDRLAVHGSIGLDINPISAESKKNDEVEELRQQISTLQLAVEGRLVNLQPNIILGRGNTGIGVVESISQDTFTTPAQVQAKIDQSILTIVENTPDTLNTLDRLAAAINDDANFAVSVTNLIATKANINSSIMLTNRSSLTGQFNADGWVVSHFGAWKWVDGNASGNINVPLQSGTIKQVDPLSNTAGANKFRHQEFISITGRLFIRAENNGAWGPWREVTTTLVA